MIYGVRIVIVLTTVLHCIGTISNAASTWTFNTVFDVTTNMLTGPIPEGLRNQTHLNYLLLYENLFTGTVPNTFTNLTKLQYFKVDTNLLIGK